MADQLVLFAVVVFAALLLFHCGVEGVAAFASDLETQGSFSLDDIPADLRAWIIDAPHWQDDDWPEPFESLPDGTPSPFEDL